jgi:hypothetical protein
MENVVNGKTTRPTPKKLIRLGTLIALLVDSGIFAHWNDPPVPLIYSTWADSDRSDQ